MRILIFHPTWIMLKTPFVWTELAIRVALFVKIASHSKKVYRGVWDRSESSTWMHKEGGGNELGESIVYEAWDDEN